MLVAVAASRLAYPFELDWVEGALLEQTLRVRAGVPLYVAPSTAYVPLIYAPLFNYAAAAMAALVGPGFAALRTVSALAAAATLVITGAYVTRETGRRSAGLIAAALYAAGQHLAESWLDVGRSDSLFLALLIAGAFVYRTRAQGRGAPIAAGGLWALAWGDEGQGYRYVLSGVIRVIRPGLRLRIEPVVYFNPERAPLGPMRVSFSLREKDGVTRITVRQEATGEGPDWEWYFGVVKQGWKDTLSNLKNYLEKGG